MVRIKTEKCQESVEKGMRSIAVMEIVTSIKEARKNIQCLSSGSGLRGAKVDRKSSILAFFVNRILTKCGLIQYIYTFLSHIKLNLTTLKGKNYVLSNPVLEWLLGCF